VRHGPRVEHAKAKHAALATQVPEVRILLSGVGASEARIILDGREMPLESLKASQPVDPGEHLVTITSLEEIRMERVFTVARGEKKVIEFEVGAKPAVIQKLGPQPAPPDLATPEPVPEERISNGAEARRAIRIGALGRSRPHEHPPRWRNDRDRRKLVMNTVCASTPERLGARALWLLS
jgi:hypothetical protein